MFNICEIQKKTFDSFKDSFSCKWALKADEGIVHLTLI